jgi:3-phosphoshikimate 1-carboxyvinyltransferase
MITIRKIPSLRGTIVVPGDKSISHRAVMMASIAKGKSRIKNLLMGQDCQATINAFRAMGIAISTDKGVVIDGKGLRGLSCPKDILYLGNSGTTMRLLPGILAGQNFKTALTGDNSLSQRPMKRVTRPLKLMGVDITGRENASFAPLNIKGAGTLNPIDYKTEVASAQVKSAIMFAGLYADGNTTITEPYKSRDHTERIFELFGADIKQEGLAVSVQGMGQKEFTPQDICIPGDISSAAFFMALGILSDDAEISIENCGLNRTRTGIVNVLKNMGADINIISGKEYFEPKGRIIVKSSSLKAITIKKEDIPLMIDEIPLIALCATQAEGTTVIEGVAELRVKETDRVHAIMTSLKALGASIQAEENNLIIKGPVKLKGAPLESFGDHRIAMMSVIAGAIAEGDTSVSDTDCIDVSFPGFKYMLDNLIII